MTASLPSSEKASRVFTQDEITVPCQIDKRQHYLYQTIQWGHHQIHHRLS